MLSLIFGLSLGLFLLWQSYRTLEVQNLRKTWGWSYIITYIKEKEAEGHSGRMALPRSHNYKVAEPETVQVSLFPFRILPVSGAELTPLFLLLPCLVSNHDPHTLTFNSHCSQDLRNLESGLKLHNYTWPNHLPSFCLYLFEPRDSGVFFPSFLLRRQCVAGASWREAFYTVRV